MRTSNLHAVVRPSRAARRATGRSIVTAALAVSTAVVLAGCAASAAPTAVPTPVPTPVVTPDPHLVAPASVDDVYRKLTEAGLRITPNTASGAPGHEPVKRINATFASWPLILSEYSTAAALTTDRAWDPKAPLGRGEPPFALAGLNILVEFGPRAVNEPTPETPDAPRREAAVALAKALDPLLGPLQLRTVEPLPVAAAASPVASPGGSGESEAAPSTAP